MATSLVEKKTSAAPDGKRRAGNSNRRLSTAVNEMIMKTRVGEGGPGQQTLAENVGRSQAAGDLLQ